MTRPKGSLNKIQKPKVKHIRKTKPKPLGDRENYQTLKDLKNIAKDENVKVRCGATREELRHALVMEPQKILPRYNHCHIKKTAQVIIKTNVETGEETKYNSIFKLANSLGLFAGSITYRIKVGKSLVVDDITYTFRKE